MFGWQDWRLKARLTGGLALAAVLVCTAFLLPPRRHISRRPAQVDHSAMMNSVRYRLAAIPEFRPDRMTIALSDVRSADLSGLDLAGEGPALAEASFDTRTIWPAWLPPGFFPSAVLENGKDPGLGVRGLHARGIDGRGVAIAMIDLPLLVDHADYRRALRWYEEVNGLEDDASMHGSAMASIAVGRSCGVAPGAGLYYVASFNMKWDARIRRRIPEYDYVFDAMAVDRVLEISAALPAAKKIRALSISAAWSPEMKGYRSMTEAAERARKAGLFVVSCNMFETYDNKFFYQILERDPARDPDDAGSYSVIPWRESLSVVRKRHSAFDRYYEQQFARFAGPRVLLIPVNSRTSASPTGARDYAYSRRGGWSVVEPLLAGLYALACQVRPDVTPELFWETALATGTPREFRAGDKTYDGRIIDPVRLIERLHGKI